MKAEYDAHAEAAYWAAEEATNGFMVNRSGKADGVSALSLFSGSAVRAYRYASEELLQHWVHYPRPVLPAFEAQWLAARVGGGWHS